jgi:hypothetical protein
VRPEEDATHGLMRRYRVTSPPRRGSSALAEVSAYLLLAAILVGVYLAYVLAGGWLVLHLLGTGAVSTGGWVATIGLATVLGVASGAGAGFRLRSDRLMLAGLFSVPILVEVAAFGVVRPA